MHSQPASWCQGMSVIWEGARQDFLGALRFLAQVEMTWPEQRATVPFQVLYAMGASSGWRSWPWKFEAPASALKQDIRHCVLTLLRHIRLAVVPFSPGMA